MFTGNYLPAYRASHPAKMQT